MLSPSGAARKALLTALTEVTLQLFCEPSNEATAWTRSHDKKSRPRQSKPYSILNSKSASNEGVNVLDLGRFPRTNVGLSTADAMSFPHNRFGKSLKFWRCFGEYLSDR